MKTIMMPFKKYIKRLFGIKEVKPYIANGYWFQCDCGAKVVADTFKEI